MLDIYVVSKVSYNRNSRCRCVTIYKMPKKQTIHHLFNTQNVTSLYDSNFFFSTGDLEAYRVMGRIIDYWRIYDVLATA